MITVEQFKYIRDNKDKISISEMAFNMELKYHVVADFMKKHGWEANNKPPVMTQERRKIVKENAGKTINEIAEIVFGQDYNNVHVANIRRYCENAGIDFKRVKGKRNTTNVVCENKINRPPAVYSNKSYANI